MEVINEDFFTLSDHLNKCRCCFRILIDEQKVVKVTKNIEKNFFDLTQIKVRKYFPIAQHKVKQYFAILAS